MFDTGNTRYRNETWESRCSPTQERGIAVDQAQCQCTAQAKAGLPVTADKNWVIVTPQQIQ